MHDLKFVKAVEVARLLRRRQVFTGSLPCQRAHDIFRSNTELAKALLVVPGNSFMLGSVWQNSIDHALAEVCGEDHPKEVTETVANQIGTKAEGYFVRSMRHPENNFNDACIKMTVNLERMVRETVIHDALELTLKSVVIQVWTAFEILTEQLLLLSLDGHKECFSKEVHDKTQKFRFRRLDAILGAYKTAFSGDSKIDALLDDPTVKACALLRHLLVHCGGAVDKKFLTQCQEPPIVRSFWKWKDSQKIEIDGEMVCSLVDPVLHYGFTLIELVYSWIQTHTPTSP